MSDFQGERLSARACVSTNGMIGVASDDAISPAPGQGRSGHQRNDFIRKLRPADLAAIGPMLTPVTFKAGQVLYPAGVQVRDLHLITEGLVALSAPFADGHCPTVALAGPEGIIGLCPALSGQPAIDSATVMIAGGGYRLPAHVIKQLFADHPDAVTLLVRTLSLQVSELQVELACRTRHTVEQRLARLLLAAFRKLGANRLVITQEELAEMLGVQRTTVSALAAKLKERGALAYLRGAIRIADTQRLELAACGCAVAPLRTESPRSDALQQAGR